MAKRAGFGWKLTMLLVVVLYINQGICADDVNSLLITIPTNFCEFAADYNSNEFLNGDWNAQ
jgi:hypothetical protein